MKGQKEPQPLDRHISRFNSMAKITSSSFTTLLLLILLTTTAPQPSQSLNLSRYRNLISLSHSLLTRVSNLRAARGDIAGANRAKLLSQKLERSLGLGFWGFAWSTGWDYVKNYAWRELDYRDLYGAVSDLNELMWSLGEFMRINSEMEKAAWVGQNYGNVLGVSKRLFVRLLKVFRQSGPIREVVKTVQTEVVDGGLLRDCLELGSNDLQGLIQIFKDLILQYSPTVDHDHHEL